MRSNHSWSSSKRSSKHWLSFLAGLVCAIGPIGAEPEGGFLKVENVALPQGVPPEVGAMRIADDGTMYLATRRNDIFVARLKKDSNAFEWKIFASGFNNTCGMEILGPGKLLVAHMAEISEVSDTDGDMVADQFLNLSNDFGLSGNYHETNATCSDGSGGFYIAIGTASHNGPTFWKTRGEYSPIGRRGRNFSSVKWRGWVMHYKDGKLSPYASGFRMPNGIFRDEKGRLWAGDNEGDWRATTPFYLVKKGGFYGHPSSLVWDENFPKGKDPLKMPLTEIDAMRTRASVLIPHEHLRSASEPQEIPAGFGAFEGQLILLDNNRPSMMRIMIDEVKGQLQGSACFFLNDERLQSGNNRVAFSPDGKEMYVGQTTRGWGKLAEGLQRISLNGDVPFDVEMINLREEGFSLKTTLPIKEGQELSLESVAVRSYYYEDKWEYGGEKKDEREESVTSISLAGAQEVLVVVRDLEAGRLYEIELTEAIQDRKGRGLRNRLFFYTANVVY